MTCFKMLAGDHIFDRLYESDSYMAVFSFCGFCVFWYFVMPNMFISMLMNGFDIVDHGLIEYVPQNPIVLIVDDFKKFVLNQVWNVLSGTSVCSLGVRTRARQRCLTWFSAAVHTGLQC